MNTRIAMILGESEVTAGAVQVKDLREQTQQTVFRKEAAKRAHEILDT
jgi:histidyl-tRNA synthetase